MAIFDINNLADSSDTIEEKSLIMLVDDEQENISILRHILEPKYNIISEINGKKALEKIESMNKPQNIQLIISDQRMPELNGVDFFEKIVGIMPDTIRIILTGYSDINAVIDSINKAQIYKFLTKPFEAADLKLTVQRGIEAYKMRKELIEYAHRLEEMVEEKTRKLQQTLEKLEKASLTDQLTGANNRRFLYQFIEQTINEVKRHYFNLANKNPTPKDIGFILIDVDHFKSVNDTYGHDAGDIVLIQITEILQTSCRESDWVVRWGGEEFLIVCSNSSREEIQSLAERIRINIEMHSFDIRNNQVIKRTCSMGLSTYPFSVSDIDFINWEEALHLADIALYRAKNGGRNAWISLFDVKAELDESFKQDLLNDTETLLKIGKLGTESSSDRDD